MSVKQSDYRKPLRDAVVLTFTFSCDEPGCQRTTSESTEVTSVDLLVNRVSEVDLYPSDWTYRDFGDFCPDHIEPPIVRDFRAAGVAMPSNLL